jgi:hypothetical protein
MDEALIDAYCRALSELLAEKNEAAKIMFESIKNERRSNLFTWARYIHHNEWGPTSFASTLKARVVLNRIRYEN